MKNKIIIITLLCLANTSLYASDEDAQELYLEAKMMCVEQEWIEAIDTFEEVISQYSDSRYVDDAHFWIGYCLEKIPQRQTDAFLRFDKVVNQFPKSSWADDAIIHQVTLAEQFVREGKNQYKSFLAEHLNSTIAEIRNRTALALGRLGDKRALPVLKDITKDKDFGAVASNLVASLEGKDMDISRRVETDTSQKTIQLMYEFQKQKEIEQQEDDEGDFFSFFNSQHYEQYKSMLHKDNEWSKNELNEFALWHILDTDVFQEYITLSNEYDKKEWTRKYWKSYDPTPTTEKNELYEEFEQRIIYARAHFSTPWNYTHFRYLPDQHIRDGWDHAPWDARGELYIKYGEPYVRSIEGWHTEEWIYYKYGVDFIVKQYMTNIYGNAISGGQISISRYGGRLYNNWYSWAHELDANYIYNNEIKYEHAYNADPIEDFELYVLISKSLDRNVTIKYNLPASELDLSKNNAYFDEQFVIFDSDLREVLRSEAKRKVENLKDTDDIIEKNIAFYLPSGEYLIALKIQYPESNKLGIFKQDFTVE